MQREYTLQGLNCAHCASLIEADISKVEGVESASVSVMTSSLALTLADRRDDITAVIEHIVHQHEPDVSVIDKTAPKAEGISHVDSDKGEILRLIAGASVFAAGFAVEVLTGLEVLAATLFMVSCVISGGSVLLRAVKNIARGRVFDEHFLMSAAAIGAFAIGEFPEGAAVMLFYQIGEFFQDAAVRKSKKSITDLMDIRPDYAHVMRNGGLLRVAPDTVSVGERIVVKPGEKIPLDGVIVEGEGLLDTKSLTGESLPRSVKPGDPALSGCVSQSGLLTLQVTKPYGESTVSKIIELVENASAKKAPAENFITSFSRYYTPVVVIMAALLAMIPPLFMDGIWTEWIRRGLVFLVISCPCALVISIPLSFFGGIGGASRRGILVKGGNFLEALNHLDMVVFDKTGTLTKGVFEVVYIHAANGFLREDVLEAAAYAEAYSNHPIAVSIRNAYGKNLEKEIRDFTELAGCGTGVLLYGKRVLAGNETLMAREGIEFTAMEELGTKVYVSIDGAYAGCLVIADALKPDSREAILALKAAGVRKTVMLTGDNRAIAEKIAAELSLDEVCAPLLPHEKVEALERLDQSKRPKKKLAYVGDGINDAPVLALADIGIAMGGLGSDAAIEAADVVLMTDEPSKVAAAIEIARATRRVVWQNILFALGIKCAVLLLGALGWATMWEAVFADVGVSCLAILNAMRLLRK